MADYSERATQLPEPNIVSNVTPANAALVEAASGIAESATALEKQGKQEMFAEQSRNNYQDFLGSAQKEVRDIARADQLEAARMRGVAISEADQKWLAEHQNAVNVNRSAYDQGFKRLRDFRLDEEARLRAAIRARPDLGDELRAISQRELGIDVYTASMKMFNEDLQAAQQAAEEASKSAAQRTANNMKYIRDMVDLGGSGAEIYRGVDPNAPPESPRSIEAAHAKYSALLAADPKVQDEAFFKQQRASVNKIRNDMTSYASSQGWDKPEVFASIVADTAQRNAAMQEIDKKIVALEAAKATVLPKGTGAYAKDAETVTAAADSAIAELKKLKENFTAQGVQSYLDMQQNLAVIEYTSTDPSIAALATDVIPKGTPETERIKYIVGLGKIREKAGTQDWTSANEYVSTVTNGVQHVNNMLISDTVRSPALLPARAPEIASHIGDVSLAISKPTFRDENGRVVAAPIDTLFNRRGTGFLNVVTQSGTIPLLYAQLDDQKKKELISSISDVGHNLTQQLEVMAKAALPPEAAKWVGGYRLAYPVKDADGNLTGFKVYMSHGGNAIGWKTDTPQAIKDKYQGELDRIQSGIMGENGLMNVRTLLDGLLTGGGGQKANQYANPMSALR